MTRFARAVGSKSSNKRVPDDSTPWSQLKCSHFSQSLSINYQSKQVKKIRWKRKEGENDTLVEGLLMNKYDGNENEFKSKKHSTDCLSAVKNSKEIGVVRFEGFPVRLEDAVRLKELKKKLLSSKVPHNQIKRTMQLERRKAEKALSREKKRVCFHCRQSGHALSVCPNLNNDVSLMLELGICFKCGSTEHQHTQCRAVREDNYKFAICFICKQKGHISKQCPDNPRGLYPEGGCCRICGDVTHMKKECPKLGKRKNFEITLGTLDSRKPEVLEDYNNEVEDCNVRTYATRKKKIIKLQ